MWVNTSVPEAWSDTTVFIDPAVIDLIAACQEFAVGNGIESLHESERDTDDSSPVTGKENA